MTANLLSLAQEALGGDFSKVAGQFLGESQGSTQSALTSLLPAVLGMVAQKGATPEGASGLLSLINGAKLDVDSLGNMAGLFGGGRPRQQRDDHRRGRSDQEGQRQGRDHWLHRQDRRRGEERGASEEPCGCGA
jgi:hypothetical protein